MEFSTLFAHCGFKVGCRRLSVQAGCIVLFVQVDEQEKEGLGGGLHQLPLEVAHIFLHYAGWYFLGNVLAGWGCF